MCTNRGRRCVIMLSRRSTCELWTKPNWPRNCPRRLNRDRPVVLFRRRKRRGLSLRRSALSQLRSSCTTKKGMRASSSGVVFSLHTLVVAVWAQNSFLIRDYFVYKNVTRVVGFSCGDVQGECGMFGVYSRVIRSSCRFSFCRRFPHAEATERRPDLRRDQAGWISVRCSEVPRHRSHHGRLPGHTVPESERQRHLRRSKHLLRPLERFYLL